MLSVAGTRAGAGGLLSVQMRKHTVMRGTMKATIFAWAPLRTKSISTTFIKVPTYFKLETANV